MNKIELKQKFINLKLGGFTISEISKILGISERTVTRWSSAFSAEISMLKNERANAVNEKLASKIDSYIDFLDKNFSILKKELDSHSDIRVPYQKLLLNSLKIFESVQKLASMRVSLPVAPKNTDIEKIAENINDMQDDLSD